MVVVHGLVGLAGVLDDPMTERDAAGGNAVGELEITEHRRRRRRLHLLLAAAPEPGNVLEVIGDVARRGIPRRLCRGRLRRRRRTAQQHRRRGAANQKGGEQAGGEAGRRRTDGASFR